MEFGKIYTCSLTNAHAPQKTICFGSMELPSGKYIIIGSAKHSMLNGICAIGVGTSMYSMPTTNGQIIYGNANYDINRGTVMDIFDFTKTTIVYFQVWAESDFEIVPTSFTAVRINML